MYIEPVIRIKAIVAPVDVKVLNENGLLYVVVKDNMKEAYKMR